MAAQRQAVVDGLRTSISKPIDGIDTRELTTTILTMQYLEMLNHAASNGKNSFILPSSPTHISQIENDLRLATQTGLINKTI